MAGVKEYSLGKYTLVFNMRALHAVEEILGPLPAIMIDPVKAGSIKTITALAQCGLAAKHGLTQEETFDVIDEIGLAVVSEAVQEALRKAYPEDDGTGGDAEGKPPAA